MRFRLPLLRISFRWQITLLGALATILLLAVLIATFAAFRYTKSAVLGDEEKRLTEACRVLSQEYASKSESARQHNEPSPLQNPASESSRSILTLLSRIAVQNDDAMKAGFFSSAFDRLIVDSSADTQLVADEAGGAEASTNFRAAVTAVARQAATSHRPAEQVISNLNDITIVAAVPILEEQQFTGSAWTAKRLPVLPGSNRFRAYVLAVGLGIASLACVILTLLVVNSLQNGVRKLEAGLEGLEGNLASQISAESDPDEIRQIASAVNRLGAALREKIESEKQIEDRLRHAERLAALGRLVAGVAHEVRNPLATIRLRVQMCQQEATDSSVLESCRVALQEIERMNGMVNRLLSFSQPVQLHAEPTDLSALLNQRLDGFHELALRNRVTVQTSFSDGYGPLHIDRSRMIQVFDNILQNAIEAMASSGGTLRVGTSLEATPFNGTHRLCISFNDTGAGIRPDAVPRIFDPFFTTKPRGTGLGLSISNEIVRAHNGEITVQSAEGRGTTVRVLLPLAAGDAAFASV